MGQTESATGRSDSRCSTSCKSCVDWGEKDVNTVKITLEQLPALLGAKNPAEDTDKNDVLHAKDVEPSSSICTPETDIIAEKCCRTCESSENTDKEEFENASPSSKGIAVPEKVNYDDAIAKAREKLTKQQEQAAAARQAEALLFEMQQNEIKMRVREELQRVQEEQDRLRECERRANQVKLEQDKQAVAEYRQQSKEALRLQQEEADRLAEEARCKEEEENENREQVRSWLRKNGFRDVNELKRKMLHKVRPLHIAVQRGDATLVKLLLAAGADVHLADGNNETVVQLAKRVDKKENSIRSDVVLRLISPPVSS